MSSHIPLPKEKHNKSKLFVTRSHLLSKKHEHSKLIQTHPFNHQISIISQSTTVRETLAKYIGSYYNVTLKLSDFIDPAFISNYIKRNTLIALSSNRYIDADDVFAIDGQKLILSVGKDTYETLGLVGKSAQFPVERGSRFVVEIDLLDCMDPAKKYYQRVHNRLNAVLNEPVEFLVGYFDKNTGTPVTFDIPGATVVTPQVDTRSVPNMLVPNVPECLISTNEQTDTWTEHAHELFEWIGLATSCSQAVAGTSDEQTSAYTVPEPTSKDMHIVTVRGLLSATAIHSVINELVAAHTEFYVCVWGFDDAPVSWNSSEHNFYVSGENMYAQAYVPHKNCCLSFQACGPWDAFS
ncbi:hypothetical protein GGH19_004950 [Coemansia sp. RSA 1807]|nr:hypothetical protein GGH19_004950 [Coemansia sp. RSA 1807]